MKCRIEFELPDNDIIFETVKVESVKWSVWGYSGLAKVLPQGEWVLMSEVASNLGHKCSNCGEKAKKIVVRSALVDNYYCNKAEPITEYTHKEQLSKFCPNCGARMFAKDTNVPNKEGADDE